LFGAALLSTPNFLPVFSGEALSLGDVDLDHLAVVHGQVDGPIAKSREGIRNGRECFVDRRAIRLRRFVQIVCLKRSHESAPSPLALSLLQH